MPLRISGKNVDIGQALRTRIDETVSTTVAKYFNGGFSGQVTVAKGARVFETECVVHLDSGMVFESHGAAADAHASFDQAAERIEKRLRRYKGRLKDHKRAHSDAETASSYVLQPPPEEEVAEDYAPAIVAETTMPIPTVSVSGAVMQLDRTEAPVVVFRNAAHGGLNVVFRRADGNFGWVDLAAMESAAAGRDAGR